MPDRAYGHWTCRYHQLGIVSAKREALLPSACRFAFVLQFKWRSIIHGMHEISQIQPEGICSLVPALGNFLQPFVGNSRMQCIQSTTPEANHSISISGVKACKQVSKHVNRVLRPKDCDNTNDKLLYWHWRQSVSSPPFIQHKQ